MFLDSIREKQAEEERLRKAQDARESAINNPPLTVSQLTKSTNDTADKDKGKAAVVPSKKDARKVLKGVIVKKKTKAHLPLEPSSNSNVTSDDQPEAKRRKID
ncbi:hypothetical protein ID866_1745 [Astraeus odoratus]|nr:hypothetical protein ID866_1745 [Astraeus odoratus]